MTSIDGVCKILKAYEEGKTIQCKYELPTSTRGVLGFGWEDIDPYKHYVTSLMNMELRIKPEPREIWVLLYRDGSMMSLLSKSEAEEWAEVGSLGYTPEIIHYREVSEDE